MKRVYILLVVAIGFGMAAARPAAADSLDNICPPIGVATECNIFIEVNLNGTASLLFTDPVSGNPAATQLYDCTQYHCHNGTFPDGSGDDWLVGVYNISNQTVTGLAFTGNRIFEVDEGDGICSSYFAGGTSLCSMYPYQGGFNGPNTVFYIYDYPDPYSNGTVFFGSWDQTGTNFTNSGLAPGGTTYFSLTGPPTTATQVPEPTTLALLSTGLLGLGGILRRKLIKR